VNFLQGVVQHILEYFYNLTGDYGVAIIGLTILVRLVTLPLSLKQIASSRAMQKIAPLQKKLQEKYKDNPEKYNQELLALYREHKINPLAGCLPTLIQLPVIVAVFGVLRNPGIASTDFLGIVDLSKSFVQLFKEATAISGYLVPAVIPVLASLTTYIQTKQTLAGQAGSAGGMGAMPWMMPALILFFSYSLPQGLPLYWLVGNVFSIVQHFLLGRSKPSAEGGVLS